MLQQALFAETPRARRTDPSTSHSAAERMRVSGALGKQAAAVLEAVKTWPGFTAVEISQRAQIDRHAVSRRLPDLVARGMVRRGPPIVCSVNGRPQSTWFPVTR